MQIFVVYFSIIAVYLDISVYYYIKFNILTKCFKDLEKRYPDFGFFT